MENVEIDKLAERLTPLIWKHLEKKVRDLIENELESYITELIRKKGYV